MPHVTPESVRSRIESEPKAGRRAGPRPREVPEGHVSSGEAARGLGISKGRLSALVSEGTVAARKEGRSRLVPVSEVEKRKALNPGPGRPRKAACAPEASGPAEADG